MLRAVDAAQALADLTEISSQIVHVAIVDAEGAVRASTLADEARAARFADGAVRLLEAADEVRSAHGLAGLVQLEAVTLDGSIFIVRPAGSTMMIAAATRPEPTVGLVFYDLKHCLKAANAPSNDEFGNDEPDNDDRSNDEPGNDEPSDDDRSNNEPGDDDANNDEPSNDEPDNDEPGSGERRSDEPSSGEEPSAGSRGVRSAKEADASA
jgi:predicted regulator of Ras-like GTPase activity (Roadblock/LC7/MglB family)